MKTVMSHLRLTHNILLCFYIDDTILIGRTLEEVTRAVRITLELLTELGFTINREKSVLMPSQREM